MPRETLTILDCTLRDGGYYTNWDFSPALVNEYLSAMRSVCVDFVELGFRSLINNKFRGAYAYTTDDFIRTLHVPEGISIGVMINASEILSAHVSLEEALEALFPEPASSSPVTLVRIACHVHEFFLALPACSWLKSQGYMVGFNLMQIADQSQAEVESLAMVASSYPLDVLYFADSLGSMLPDQAVTIVQWLRKHWRGPIGIHTHDNMGLALQNTLASLERGVSWVDSTVTGMGRGPGNSKTEYLVLELSDRDFISPSLTPLLALIRKYFSPLQNLYGWGTNSFYYLAGKYGIHPTYIQEMLSDPRFSEEDILAAIEHLRIEGGKKYSPKNLNAARHFYSGKPRGTWKPSEAINAKEVLLLAPGPRISDHCSTLERYIQKNKPYVLALNTQTIIDSSLINARAACHPIRLLADCAEHARLAQPLITPASMLPDDVIQVLDEKSLLDFGIDIQPGKFIFGETHCVLPSALVVAYALAIANSGGAKRILLAGFDGYGADDPRTHEMQSLFNLYSETHGRADIFAVTPTRYSIPSLSIYAM